MSVNARLAVGSSHTDTQRVVEADRTIKRKRSVVASAKRIEEIIAVGQRRGLNVSKVVQLRDGTCEVHFGASITAMKHNPYEWKV
jgi:hypothetical protein